MQEIELEDGQATLMMPVDGWRMRGMSCNVAVNRSSERVGKRHAPSVVMVGLDPTIHGCGWILGARPGMTRRGLSFVNQ